MGPLRIRLAGLAAVAALVTAVFFGLAGPAPGAAGADAQLRTVPGLDAVTYAQTAAYVATIRNTGTITLKNVRFHNPVPFTVVGGQPQPATFQSSSCSGSVGAGEFSCLVTAALPVGASVSVTVAWKTPAAGSSPSCGSAGAPCLATGGYWTAGVGNPMTFPMAPAHTSLLSGSDPSKAATYALQACTSPSSPTLATNQAVGPSNPLATSVCAPNLPANDPLHPGLVTAIEEVPHSPSDPGVTQVSEICLPRPGTACEDESPFVFSPLATFTFVIHNASLPPGETIDKVFHDGVLVSTNRRADPHVVSIKNERFKGITTVVVRSSTNGSWDFG